MLFNGFTEYMILGVPTLWETFLYLGQVFFFFSFFLLPYLIFPKSSWTDT